jgi:ribonuclease D
MNARAAPKKPVWLETAAQLDQWLAASPDAPLALDTEFERVNTFYPIPGLVQLGLNSEFRLVEPAVAQASEGFRQALTSPDRPKLLYAMSEDLELLRHWLNLDPRAMLDLQVGAAMAGMGFSVGYARLVETLFGATLDKSATRSDWIARPLSEKQLRYALDDVYFLQPMHDEVTATLHERELHQAWLDECARFSEELGRQTDPDDYYLRIRGGWHLNAGEQRVLRVLAQWRERECRQRDRPRNRVLSDALLIAIAENQPRSAEALRTIADLPPVVIRRYGNTLIDLIQQGRSKAPNPVKIPPPLTRDQQDRFRQVKKIIKSVAEERDVPVELLASRRLLEAHIRQVDAEPEAANTVFEGWRGDMLLPVMANIDGVLRSE